MYKFMRRFRGGIECPPEPALTPPVYSRSSIQKNMESFLSQGELSPGILDLHSIDTELLSEVSDEGFYDTTSPFIPVVERGFENNLEALTFVGKQQSSKLKMLSEGSPPKAVTSERERSIKDSGVPKIKVVVRRRPLNKKEISKKEEDIITIEPNCCSLTVHETKLKVDLTAYVEKHEFVFDAVLDDHVSSDEVYRETVEPIVPAIFQRTKATCFAYGQTGKLTMENQNIISNNGSGKTFTMQPLPLKACQHILNLVQKTYRNQGFQLWVGFFEIYGGKLFDLLNERRKLCMREDGKQQVCIVGLQEYRVSDVETVRDFIERGNAARSTGSTGANEESSRSHAILQLVIKRSADGSETKPSRMVGKLSFIDLAGSERGADTTDNDRQTRMEGAEINKSLLALKECIRALDNDQGHIPFRGSKLTEVLRDSFVGDSRTVMISCIAPNSGSCEHTLNTLRYADRVKSLSKSNNISAKKDTISALPMLREPSSPTLVTVPSQFNPESNILEHGDSNYRCPEQQSAHSNNQVNDGDNYQILPIDHDGRPSSAYTNSRVHNRLYDQEEQEHYRQVLTSSRRGSRPNNMHHTVNPKEEVAPNRRHRDLSGTIHMNVRLKDIMEDSGGDMDVILKEEEDLVNAHRQQVEGTIDIVREEMKLLSESDKPGSHIDRYISRLSQILSQKAAGIVSLQNRVARFQRLLNDQNILVCSAGGTTD
eukprot:Gb_21615 [translate_table: standard]